MRLVKVNLVLLVITMSLALQWHAEAESAMSSSASGCGAAVMQNNSLCMVSAVGRSVIGITSSSSTVAYAGSQHFHCDIGNGTDSVSAAPSIASVEPDAGQNYPNPFNPETWIPYRLVAEANVKIAIYDVCGQLVRALEIGVQPAGRYFSKDKAAHWDGKNEAGEEVASGIYFYTITAGDFSATRKMVVRR